MADVPPKILNAVVLADSVAMSRSSAGQVLWDAWPQILYRRGVLGLTWVRARGAATSSDVLAEARLLGGYLGPQPAFDVAFLQVGIVDCCPRPLPRRVQHLVDRAPERTRLSRWVRNSYPVLLRLRARPWVAPPRYKHNVEAIVREVLRFCGRVVLLETLAPGPGLIEKVGDFTGAVRQYNDILRGVASTSGERVRSVDLQARAGAHLLLPDGHHFTSAGHEEVADAVERCLASW